MTLGREMGWTLAVLLAAAASGCAPMATKPGPTTAGTPPASTATHPAATSTGTPPSTAPRAASIDTTTPSPAAERVLASIPEPLTPAQQALNAAQDSTRAHGTAVAPAAAYDSLQAAPVPAATQPLGTEVSTVTLADSSSSAPPSNPAAAGSATSTASGAAATGAAAGAAGGATAGSAASGGAATGGAAGGAAAGAAAAGGAAASSASGTGPCWRLQVGAPLESEKEKADSRRDAAQSLLMVSFTIVPEKGYLKVRTTDCMGRDAADALKKRAVESGFDDAFLVDTNAAPPPPAHKHQNVPASKRKH